MGIENELKYVLRDTGSLEAALAAVPGVRVEEVFQGYLNPETRVRRFVSPEGESLVFSFKRRLPDGANVEIETELTDAEFGLLWGATEERLCKRRYKVSDDGVDWDVDFFHEGGEVYIVVAEAEMPEGMARPARVLPAIEASVVLAVDRADGRFASRRLASAAYARAVAAEVGAAA
jgi:CYTH domain-containing protein